MTKSSQNKCQSFIPFIESKYSEMQNTYLPYNEYQSSTSNHPVDN